jgi:hypothetical protein
MNVNPCENIRKARREIFYKLLLDAHKNLFQKDIERLKVRVVLLQSLGSLQ